jgi:hypothetical protein
MGSAEEFATIRAERADARAKDTAEAAQRASGRSVYESSLLVALGEQDERARRAVRAFLTEVDDREAQALTVFAWERTVSHHSETGASAEFYGQAVHVFPSGQVVLDEKARTHYAHAAGGHRGDRIQRLACPGRREDFRWTRGASAQGGLPFVLSRDGAGGRSEGEIEPGPWDVADPRCQVEQLSATTRWFLERLVDYVDGAT